MNSICEGSSCNGCVQPTRDDAYAQLEKERSARENHCQIERRRRNKMSAYITELCQMLPSCNSVSRRPDKLTILRMAVGHLKNLRGTYFCLLGFNICFFKLYLCISASILLGANNIPDNSHKESFLTDQELRHLILEVSLINFCNQFRIFFFKFSFSFRPLMVFSLFVNVTLDGLFTYPIVFHQFFIVLR